jgi:DNA-binding NarL/FixJ family response regulator
MKSFDSPETICDVPFSGPAEPLNNAAENSSEPPVSATRDRCSRFTRPAKPITVLLAENRTIVRQGICAVLALEKDIRVVGEASDGAEAEAMVEKVRPDVVLMSVTIAFLNRMQATRHILQHQPAPRVIILARMPDETSAREAATLGASAFLTEQVTAEALAGTVREISKGGRSFGPGVSLSRSIAEKSHPVSAAVRLRNRALTSRQTQVLQLIAEGKSNKQTASDLCISIKTVEKHRENLMATLGIHETAGLTRYAISSGLVNGTMAAA